jgi:A/G-specific adenine glycosylase
MKKRLTTRQIRTFQKIIWSYYYANGRHDLPWRKTRNPYHILVSEVMLQQTQVERVLSKYMLFLNIFPTLKSLASAPLSDIITVWQGLGYNRRAVALKKTAGIITDTYHGRFPKMPDVLRTLPGIGHATASAIAAFAFNRPVLFVETNIRTVFIHYFFPRKKKIHDGEIISLLEQTLDASQSREWYYALMDYGAYLKMTYRNPNNRSVHYVKQSRFQGSSRQVRGQIMRLLLQNGAMSRSRIERSLQTREYDIDAILDQLRKDELIRKKGSTYVID